MSKLINLPVLPLRDVVIFPNMTFPLFVGREKSIKSIENANEYMFLVAQKDAIAEDLDDQDIYQIGIISKIKQSITLPDKTIKLVIEGESLGRIIKFNTKDHWNGEIELIENLVVSKNEDVLCKSLRSSFDQYMKMQKKYSADLTSYLANINDIFQLSYTIVTHMELKTPAKQEILEIFEGEKLAEKMIHVIESEMSILQAERRIRSRIKSQIEKNQKEYYLNEQIKAIQKELGEADEFKEELAEFEKKIKTLKLTDHARNTAKSELKKLKQMSSFSAEASVARNYLDFLLSLPWGKKTKVNTNLEEIKKELEDSHYGMKKVKERIFELVVQRKRVKESIRSAVLCFCGSPGTGKTTIAQAAGKAMGLKTISIPLGGVKDEAALRGHRKTYIGAMPGKIMQAIKDAGTTNLLIILDEIGSMGQDMRSSPEDVLLEILDPAQNRTFQDNYLGTGFDLSNILFMATTNTLDLKPALVDRLEIIEVSGYTQEEKNKIAQEYLIPKLLKEHGMTEKDFKILEPEVNKIIRNYTYESGVRGLEQKLAQLIRKCMCKLEEEKLDSIEITQEKIQSYLGHIIYEAENGLSEPVVGVATGLAYVGKREGQEGEVLYIEAVMVPGNGKIECTGRLGETMKESTQVAFKYLLSNAKKYGIDETKLKEKNIYIHIPSGATPKDGPSAGIAMVCAILSALRNEKIRNDIAITGEVSLHKVLKVGGIKEKLLAAYRREPKINKIFIPYDNANDVEELPKHVRESVEIIPVKHVDEVIKEVFINKIIEE